MGYLPCQEVQNLSLQHAILALKVSCAGQNAVQLEFIGSNKTLRTCVPNQIIESNRFSSREPIQKTAKRQTWAMGPIAVPKNMFFLKRGKHRQTIPFWWSLSFGFHTFFRKQPAKNTRFLWSERPFCCKTLEEILLAPGLKEDWWSREKHLDLSNFGGLCLAREFPKSLARGSGDWWYCWRVGSQTRWTWWIQRWKSQQQT